jgi:hypothetical protein
MPMSGYTTSAPLLFYISTQSKFSFSLCFLQSTKENVMKRTKINITSKCFWNEANFSHAFKMKRKKENLPPCTCGVLASPLVEQTKSPFWFWELSVAIRKPHRSSRPVATRNLQHGGTDLTLTETRLHLYCNCTETLLQLRMRNS